MKKQLKLVETFHRAFGIPVREKPVAFTSEEEIRLRHRLMEEENNEYLQAALNNDLIETADALGDMLYILLGTMLTHGMQHKIEEIFDEIQRSNMSKLGPDGKPIHRQDGKVLKGPGFFPPDLNKILRQK